MKLDEILSTLQEMEHIEAVRPYWDASLRAFPAAVPALVDPDEIRSRRQFGGLGDEADVPLLETACRIAAQPALLHLLWHTAWVVFHCPDAVDLANWPKLERTLGDHAGCFYLLVALELVPHLRVYHQALGIPLETTRETGQSIRCICENYRRGNGGRFGAFPGQVAWIRNLTRNPFFRIGRMEYWARSFNGINLAVYRQRGAGDVLALAADGVHFTAEGLVDSTSDTKTRGGWTARLVQTAEDVVGCPIAPGGKALRAEVRLPRKEWEPVLVKGDCVLEMHIPPGGGMTLEACGNSMRQAAEFFRRYFPGLAPVAITTHSWLFHPQLEAFLPADANLVRYQRELYLYPVPTNARDGLWFIFLQDQADPATAPRETSLQRAILDYLAAGHTWGGSGGMFFLLEDLAGFGTQPYRRQWPPAIVKE